MDVARGEKSASDERIVAIDFADPEGRAAREVRREGDDRAKTGSAKVESLVCAWASAIHDENVKTSKEMHDIWDDCERAFDGEALERLAEMEPGLDGLAKIAGTLETRTLDGLWPDRQFFRCYDEDSLEDQSGAENMEAYVQDSLEQGGARVELTSALHDAITKGTGITEAVWEEEVGWRKARDKEALPIAEGEVIEVETERLENYLISSRPMIRRVNPRSIFPSQIRGVKKFEDLDNWTRQCSLTWSQIYAQRWIKRVAVDEGGVSVGRSVGRYRNLPTREMAQEVAPDGSKSGEEYQERAEEGGSPKKVNGFRVVELNVNDMDFEGLLYRKNTDGGETIGQGDIDEFMVKWSVDEADLEPGTGRWRFTFLPDHDLLLEVERNPFPDDRVSLRKFDFMPRSDSFWGRGLYEYLWPVQETLNFIVRKTNNTIKKCADPMYAARLDSFDTRRGSYDEILDHEGGKLIPLSMTATGNPFVTVAPDPNLVAACINYLEFMWAKMQELSGAPPEVGGVGGDRKTATEAKLIRGGADEFQRFLITRMADEMLVPQLITLIKLVQRTLRIPQTILKMDQDGAKLVPTVVNPKMMMGRMRIRPQVAPEINDGMMRSQVAANLFVQLKPIMPPGVLKDEGWGRFIVRHGLRGSNMDDLFYTSEEATKVFNAQYALAQGSGMLMGGQPGQDGGQTGPVLETEGQMVNSSTGGAL